MELENAPDRKMWPVRRAAWSVEDLEQDIRLIYKQMGLKRLESIPHVDPTFGKTIEQIIIKHKPSIKEINHESFSL